MNARLLTARPVARLSSNAIYFCLVTMASWPINIWEIPARRKAAGTKFKAAENSATAACAETLIWAVQSPYRAPLLHSTLFHVCFISPCYNAYWPACPYCSGKEGSSGEGPGNGAPRKRAMAPSPGLSSLLGQKESSLLGQQERE
jgi:hypothetical protein